LNSDGEILGALGTRINRDIPVTPSYRVSMNGTYREYSSSQHMSYARMLTGAEVLLVSGLISLMGKARSQLRLIRNFLATGAFRRIPSASPCTPILGSLSTLFLLRKVRHSSRLSWIGWCAGIASGVL
jgi:hypothetical protein